jgi:hypothetical protein
LLGLFISWQNSDPYVFGPGRFTQPNEALDRFSTEDFSQSCNALLFVHDDFGSGVLGLAWLASPELFKAGGLCDADNGESFNTLLTSSFRFGKILLG